VSAEVAKEEIVETDPASGSSVRTTSIGSSSIGTWTARFQAIASSRLLMLLGLTCLFAAMPVFYIKYAALNDPDIWWHMRTGEWIIQNHHIPRVDPFSASTLGRAWVDYSWIFDVASYWVVTHFDLASVIWCQTLMRLAVTAVLFGLMRKLTPQFWKAAILTFLAMLAMAWVLPPRPGAFSVLFFALELYVFVSAQRKSDPRLLWILPGLFALWANIHIEFVTGLFMLGVLCVEPFMDRLMRMTGGLRGTLDAFHRQLWLVFFASLLAVMINPYGFHLLSTVFHYAKDTGIYDVIIEFNAMHFRTTNDWTVLLLVMLACFALGRTRPFRPAWALLLGWSAWMGFRSLREVWLMAILSIVIIADSPEEEAQAPEKKVDISIPMRLAATVAVFVAVLTGANIWPFSSQQLLRQLANLYPLGAVNYIHQNHLQGPLLNELSWGGFLIYSVPEIPVSMDGRTNVHTQDEIMRTFSLWNGASGWENRPELQHANLVISDHSWPLALLLRGDPRFRIVYEDRVCVLFQAVHPEKTDYHPVSLKP
jgi:hypothetical protein